MQYAQLKSFVDLLADHYKSTALTVNTDFKVIFRSGIALQYDLELLQCYFDTEEPHDVIDTT